MERPLLPNELWRTVFQLYFAGSGSWDEDGKRAREAMVLAPVCRVWTVRAPAASAAVPFNFVMQDVLLPYVYHHLTFRSENSLHRAARVLESESQREKFARWTRKVTLHSPFDTDVSWTAGGAVISHARSLDELKIHSICPPRGLLQLAVGSASLRQLSLVMPQDTLLAILPHIGSVYPNLRRLQLAAHSWRPTNADATARSLAVSEGLKESSFPHVETLLLSVGPAEGYARLCDYLSRCQFASLRRLVARIDVKGLADAPALAAFPDTQNRLESCYFAAKGTLLASVLPRFACRVLTLVLFGPSSVIHTTDLLYPRVQVFHIRSAHSTLRLCWNVLDSLASGPRPGTDLVCVRLAQWVPRDDLFRWDGEYPLSPDARAAWMSRMRGYASRLSEQGVLLFDGDLRAADGTRYAAYDLPDDGSF
jgi:hypothetical protein